MAVSNGVVVLAAIVAVAAIGAEALVREQEVQRTNQTVVELSTRVAGLDSALRETRAAAERANARADQAIAAADQAKVAAQAAAVPAVGSPQPRPAADIAAGHERASLICAVCHVVGPDQSAAPVLTPPAPAFAEIVNRPGTTPSGLHDFLAKPHGKMPNPSLMDQQIDELVAYMMTLRK